MEPSPPLPPPMPSGQPPIAERTSGAAVASMILGILAFVTCGLTSLPAIICGHVSLANIGRYGGRLGGRTMAIAGLTTGYLALAFILLSVAGGIALPVFSEVQHRAAATRVTTQMKQIALACHAYAEKHEGRFPETLEQLAPQFISAEGLILPEIEKGKPTSIEYFGGTKADDPDRVVAATLPAHGKQRKRVFVYTDGRVEYKAESSAPK